MVCHSLLQWTTFCQTSPPWPVHLEWPHTAWLSFIELDKAVVSVIRLASFLWVWFQCVCPLMPSRNTYRLTWVSLTLDMGYLFTAAPAKHSRCSYPWMRDISSLAAPPDLERGVASLGPPAPVQPPLLGLGVALLGRCPWPQACGSSSSYVSHVLSVKVLCFPKILLMAMLLYVFVKVIFKKLGVCV